MTVDLAQSEGFSPSLLRELRLAARPRVVLKGELLYTFGVRPNSIAYISSGWLKLSTLTSLGEERVLGVRKPGEFVALEAVADHAYTTCEVNALTDGMLLTWDTNELQKRFETQTEFTVAVGRIFARSARHDLYARAMQDASRVAARLARMLYQLAREQGRPIKGGYSLNLPLTQEELAELITVRRETVSLNFGELEREGVIRRDGRVVIVQSQEMERYLERYGLALEERQPR